MVINDKSQHSVAPRLRRGGSFDYCFITNLPLSFLSKNVYKNCSHFAKLMAMKVDYLKRPVRWSAVQLKDKLAR